MSSKTDDLCSTHLRHPEPGHHCETCARLRIERKIMHRTAKDLIAAGYLVSVDDGEEITLHDSTDLDAILAACFTTDEDVLRVRKVAGEQFFGWVQFIYGNSGWDVICDHTTNLTDALEGVSAYAERFEDGLEAA